MCNMINKKFDLTEFAGKPKKTVSNSAQQDSEDTISEEKKSVGRPRTHKQGLLKTTVTFPPELMGKLRVLALNEGKQIREILEEGLVMIIEEYENKHGLIRVPEIFRSKK